MNIGIIGVGNVGRALTSASIRAGHSVTVSSTHLEQTQRVAEAMGARAASSNRGAVDDADAIILAVPFDAVDAIVDELGPSLDSKVIIDVTNRFDPQQLDGTSNAEKIQAKLPRARVIKAFNTVFAAHQHQPTIDGIQLDGFVAGDDEDAKATTLSLVKSMGLRLIDAGPLSMSRALEGMALLNIWLNMKNGWPWQSGWKLLGPSSEA